MGYYWKRRHCAFISLWFESMQIVVMGDSNAHEHISYFGAYKLGICQATV